MPEACHCGGELELDVDAGVVPLLRCARCRRELPAAAIAGAQVDVDDERGGEPDGMAQLDT